MAVEEQQVKECEQFFHVFPAPEDLSSTVKHASDFISRHAASERPIALVTVRTYISVQEDNARAPCQFT